MYFFFKYLSRPGLIPQREKESESQKNLPFILGRSIIHWQKQNTIITQNSYFQGCEELLPGKRT